MGYREIQERIVTGKLKPELAVINAQMVQHTPSTPYLLPACSHPMCRRSLCMGHPTPGHLCLLKSALFCPLAWKVEGMQANFRHLPNAFHTMQVADAVVVKAAAQKALFADLRGTLRSKSMHAELVFSIAGSKHVSLPPPLAELLPRKTHMYLQSHARSLRSHTRAIKHTPAEAQCVLVYSICTHLGCARCIIAIWDIPSVSSLCTVFSTVIMLLKAELKFSD